MRTKRAQELFQTFEVAGNGVIATPASDDLTQPTTKKPSTSASSTQFTFLSEKPTLSASSAWCWLLPGRCPEDKVTAIERLVARYEHVAMIGDGVNDAPALTRSSLGLAMGAAGSDTAIETADVALMSDDLLKVPWLIHHSRRTISIIRQNIGFSLAIKRQTNGLEKPFEGRQPILPTIVLRSTVCVMKPILTLLLIVSLLACPIRYISCEANAAVGESSALETMVCCLHCSSDSELPASDKSGPCRDSDCNCQNCICEGALVEAGIELPAPMHVWSCWLETGANLARACDSQFFSPENSALFSTRFNSGRAARIRYQSLLI